MRLAAQIPKTPSAVSSLAGQTRYRQCSMPRM
jgi:hypothetical protein